MKITAFSLIWCRYSPAAIAEANRCQFDEASHKQWWRGEGWAIWEWQWCVHGSSWLSRSDPEPNGDNSVQCKKMGPTEEPSQDTLCHQTSPFLWKTKETTSSKVCRSLNKKLTGRNSQRALPLPYLLPLLNPSPPHEGVSLRCWKTLHSWSFSTIFYAPREAGQKHSCSFGCL